jgi:hypothetical protein
MLIRLENLLFPLTTLIVVDWTLSAPKSWPYMKTYDIWESNKPVERFRERPTLVHNANSFLHDNLLDGRKNDSLARTKGRKAKGETM